MHIYLIRHGQKQRIPGNPPLTEFGEKQAQATADYFASIPLDAIIASPVLRTQQTAKIVADTLNMPIITDKRLVERAEWYEGPFAEFMDEWRKSSEDRNYDPSTGDSSLKAGKRVEALVWELEQKKEYDSVLFVSHGGIITDFLRNVTSDDFLIENYFHSLEKFRDTSVPECSITHLIKDESGFQVQRLYGVEHLDEIKK